jgi:single-stranded DNA-binding protein
MSVAVMILGSLAKQPTQRTSKNGSVYLTASIKVAAGVEIEWWNCLAFSETAQAELLRLGDGDKLSCQGSLKLEIYTSKTGEQKISRTIFADNVLALRQQPRQRATSNGAPNRAAPQSAAQPPFDDELPREWR